MTESVIPPFTFLTSFQNIFCFVLLEGRWTDEFREGRLRGAPDFEQFDKMLVQGLVSTLQCHLSDLLIPISEKVYDMVCRPQSSSRLCRVER